MVCALMISVSLSVWVDEGKILFNHICNIFCKSLKKDVAVYSCSSLFVNYNLNLKLFDPYETVKIEMNLNYFFVRIF